MSNLSSITFAVKTAFSLLEAVKERSEQQATRFDIHYVLMPLKDIHPFHVVSACISTARGFTDLEEHSQFLHRHQHCLLKNNLGRYDLKDDADPDDIAHMIDELNEYLPAEDQIDIENRDQSAREIVLNKWTSKTAARRQRGKIITLLAGMAFEYMGTNAHRLGLRGQAEKIVASLTQALSAHIHENQDQISETFFTEGLPRRIAETLLKTSLEVAEAQPSLFTDDKTLQLAVTAFVSPLRDLNQENAGLHLTPTRRITKIRETLRGPVAVNLLQTVHEHRREIFDEDYPDKETAAGIVSDAVFEALIKQVEEGGTIYSAFTPSFLNKAYPKMLNAVAASPEAFIHGNGQHVELGREFLQGVAAALNPVEGRDNSELLQGVFELGIDLTRKHARVFLVHEARSAVAEWIEQKYASADKPWALLQINLVAHIANDMIDAFAEIDSGIPANLLSRPTEQAFLLELVGIIAEQVAQTPGLIVGEKPSPEVKNIVQGVAQFISDKHANLLTRADWQLVSAKAIELALANPGKLFGIETTGTRSEELAVTLIRKILSATHTSLQLQGTGSSVLERKPGNVLFGRTLSEALITTLELATSNAKKLTDPESQDKLEAFVIQLTNLTISEDEKLSAQDWMTAFRWYGARLIDTGSLTVTDTEILEFLSEHRTNSSSTKSSKMNAQGRSVSANSSFGAVQPGPIAQNGVNGTRASTDQENLYYNPVSAEDAEG